MIVTTKRDELRISLLTIFFSLYFFLRHQMANAIRNNDLNQTQFLFRFLRNERYFLALRVNYLQSSYAV